MAVKYNAPVQKKKKDNSAEAKAARKQAQKAYKANKGEILNEARKTRRSMSKKQKTALAERRVYREAIRHGASPAQANEEVMKYRKRRAAKLRGSHATSKRKSIHEAHKELRTKLKEALTTARSAYAKAREKNKTVKDPKKRAALNAAAKKEFDKQRTAIAKQRTKAVQAKAKKLETVHKKLQAVKRTFKKPKADPNVRVTAVPAAGAEPKKATRAKRGTKMGKNDGPQLPAGWGEKKRGRKSKAELAWLESGKKVGEMAAKQAKQSARKAKKAGTAAPAAAPAAEPKKRGRPRKADKMIAPTPYSGKVSDPNFVGPKQKRGRKPKAAAAPAAAPKASGAGSTKRTTLQRALENQNADAIKKSIQKSARGGKTAKSSKAKAAPQPEYKGGRKSKAVVAWEKATGKKAVSSKPVGRPAVSGKKAEAKPAAAPKAASGKKASAAPKAAGGKKRIPRE